MSGKGLALALVAALAAGWLLSSVTGAPGGGSPGADAEVARLREEVARLHMALGERDDRGPGARLGAGQDEKGRQPAEPGPRESFDVQAFDDADKAFRALLAYARTMLERGPDAHLALVATLDATFARQPGKGVTRGLLGSEERAARFLYPVLRFALTHQEQVADLCATVFRTMAEDPGHFARTEPGTLALFTGDLAPLLPGMVGPKRLERFRAWGRTILDTPEARQPRCVQQARRPVQRAMASWSPPVGPEEAAQRLQMGKLSPEEALAMLGRLRPEDLRRLDVGTLVGPLLERDPWRVMSVLARLRPDDATLGRLDERVIAAVVAGRLPQSAVQWWLRNTRRTRFADARAFLESGLRQADKATAGIFLLAALTLDPPCPEAWITWAQRTFRLSDDVRAALIRRKKQGR